MMQARSEARATQARWPTGVFGALPKTSTGKVQKSALRDPEWAGRDKRIN